jgi:hypothetical protein|tara:strand:+ start:200 stop:583 length:384 start_codon:yes stop_codon:yes gene_type:complete
MSDMNFSIERSRKTPEVCFDASEGRLTISGRSIPENSIQFYRPVIEWVDRMVAQSIATPILVFVQLEYFNTSSSKCLLDLFKRLEKMTSAEVHWHYDSDDEDMLEAGEDYDHIVEVPFRFIEVAPSA